MPTSTPPKQPQDRKRPSLAKKHTRSSEKNREAALDEGLRITTEAGEVYEILVGDLSGLHSHALRSETGWSFVTMASLFERDPDLDVIAAVVWLARRMSGEADLTYMDVLPTITLRFIESATLEVLDGKTGETKDTDDPEM